MEPFDHLTWNDPSEAQVTFIDELVKQIFIKKTDEVSQLKNKIISIFTMLHFKKKTEEKHLEISLFYTCVPKS